MQRIVWCLWEPPGTMPGYLRACLRTLERNAGAEVRLVTARDVERLAPSLDPLLGDRVKGWGQRSDYYRSHLLAAQGGLWVDIDSVALGDLGSMFDAAETHDLVARRSVMGHVSTSPIACRPGSPIVDRWIALQERILNNLGDGESLSWTALGGASLTEAVQVGAVAFVTDDLVAPLPWTDAEAFTSRFLNPALALRGDPVIVMLYNSGFPERLKRLPERDFLASRLMLARLVRIALGFSTPDQEAAAGDFLGRPVERLWRASSKFAARTRHRLSGVGS